MSVALAESASAIVFIVNRAEQPAMLLSIPDVQAGRDERRIAIDQVGIKGLRYPLPFMDRDQVPHTTIATCNVYVALPDDRKGTHMSRLVALLEERAAVGAAPLTVATLRDVVEDLLVRLDAPGARIELSFPFFVRKTAPVSGVASLLDYDVRLAAEWVGRWNRSHAKFPMEIPPHEQPAFEELIRGHGQFELLRA